MRCETVMQRDAIRVRDTDLVMLAAELMRDENIGFLPVVDAIGRPIGTLTDRDIAIRLAAEDSLASQTDVGRIMAREPIVCRSYEDLEVAEELMARHQKSRIMVVDDVGVLVGVVSLVDVVERDSNKHAARTFRKIVMREYRW